MDGLNASGSSGNNPRQPPQSVAHGDKFHVKQPEFGYAVTAPAVKKHRIRVPQGITTLYLIDGTSMLVPEDRKVEVSAEDATALAMRGWERLAIV